MQAGERVCALVRFALLDAAARRQDFGGSSQVSGVMGGKGGEKEKEVSEPANSPGSAQRELRSEAAEESQNRCPQGLPAWMTAECLELQRRKRGERETPEPSRSASSSEGGSCGEARSLGATPGPCPWIRFKGSSS
ncbi:uncharacterized protein O9250_005030 [Rhynochetos jubatus]